MNGFIVHVGHRITLTRGVAPGWFVVAPSVRNPIHLQFPRKFASLALSVWVGSLGFVSFAAQSPLADAVEKSDRAALRTLLKQHADVNASQADGMTALHWAAY